MTDTTHKQLVLQNGPLNVSDSPLDDDNTVKIKMIQTGSPKSQSIIIKFIMTKTNWHLFTSNEVLKYATNPNLPLML